MASVLKLMGKNKKYLGKKSGAGFYLHGRTRKINPYVAGLIKGKIVKSHARLSDEEIVHRCLGMLIRELIATLEEGIITNVRYIDLAFVMGIGFPAFRGGPLKWLDEFGIKRMVTILEKLAAERGPVYSPPVLLKTMAENGESFYERDTA
jgi:3-hydroxyacyl-CoA dehydrogenase